MAYDPLAIVEEFFESVRKVHALGAGTPETAYYPALNTLFERVGSTLSPKVLVVSQLANTGAGSPDFGFFAASQLQRGLPRPGQLPERGAVEVKAVADDSLFTSTPVQLSKYQAAYSFVLVTNLRAFQLVGPGPGGAAARLEAFKLADHATDFWALVATPPKSARKIGLAFVEYLRRAMAQNVALIDPKDVAWLLASYARDALARVEAAGDLPALVTVRKALEDALGITFEEEKGEHFFRSTLVQTLFYGLFSSWVIWARTTPRNPPRFDWRSAGWNLHVPFIATLFQQLTSPQQLKPLGLVEVLDWTGDALNRIDAAEFFQRFDQGEAVQYFYEPFLQAFDPVLRKQFGVWYTPAEVVDYMVARVDRALKDELGIADGLADERVHVLDPCCGTGGFINAVLRRIRDNLQPHGLGDALADRLRDAATKRVFGFEIMPAPFVVAHLRAGLALADMEAPLPDEARPAIYLTNALTGWEPHQNKPLPYPELEQERASADAVKQKRPILVVIGNPPYEGFAGVSEDAEERALTGAYRATSGGLAAPQGQGLNDLYVRFFRIAERRIERTGEGVVCLISNYGWLDGLSFTGMRQRYLQAFDSIAIDCLNGDKYRTGKTTPEGLADPSIFSMPSNPVGIQVGTAIVTMVRRKKHLPAETVLFRNLWGTGKREQLAQTADADPATLYKPVVPSLPLRLQFAPAEVGAGYFDWPRLPDLLPVGFPGVKTSRDEFLVDIDRAALEARIGRYLDPAVGGSEITITHPTVMRAAGRFNGPATRAALLVRVAKEQADAQKQAREPEVIGEIIRYAYRPFDVRWLYWEGSTKLLDEKRPEFFANRVVGNRFLTAGERNRMGIFYKPQILSVLGDHHLVESNVAIFPQAVQQDAMNLGANVSRSVREWLEEKGLGAGDLFDHIVATVNAPSYENINIDALRVDWPRVPLPDDADALRTSAALGAQLAALLDVERDVPGVSAGALLPGLAALAAPRGKDFSLSAGWGSVQVNKHGSRIVMPGVGSTTTRPWSDAESQALDALGDRHGLDRAALLDLIGHTAVDVKMNADARWEAVPSRVWGYTLGGYPVLKKWLSYRERAVLGRALTGDEALHFARSARRITEILCMGPKLDAAHALARETAVPWVDGRPGTREEEEEALAGLAAE